MTETDTVAATIERFHMLGSGDRVLAAFSGGADSTALAIVLQNLGHDVVLGHVDHGMRPDSGRDAAHCAEVASRLGVEILSTKVEVNPPTQAEARRVRYRALNEMAVRAGATRIATGHTLDDQAETVRLRLDRGGYGLGIPPVRANIVRPLLGLRRSDTENLCRKAGVEFCRDPSNHNPKYRRVVVRAELASASEEEIRQLTDLADANRTSAQEIAGEVEGMWSELVTAGEEELGIARDALRRAGGPVRHQMVRRMASELGVELTVRSVEDILGKVLEVTGARLSLPGGLWVWSERDRLLFGNYTEAPALPELPLAVPGTTLLPRWGVQFRAEPAEPRARAELRTAGDSSEVIDSDALDRGLTVRQWRPGDRFHPLGAPGTRKLQDFFVDTGVPRAARLSVPVVACGNRIVWVAGHRLDDRFKVTSSTARMLRLTLSAAGERAA